MDDSFKCEVCGETFDTNKELANHIYEEHTPKSCGCGCGH